jgi:hypothetical protein
MVNLNGYTQRFKLMGKPSGSINQLKLMVKLND